MEKCWPKKPRSYTPRNAEKRRETPRNAVECPRNAGECPRNAGGRRRSPGDKTRRKHGKPGEIECRIAHFPSNIFYIEEEGGERMPYGEMLAEKAAILHTPASEGARARRLADAHHSHVSLARHRREVDVSLTRPEKTNPKQESPCAHFRFRPETGVTMRALSFSARNRSHHRYGVMVPGYRL